MHSIANAVMVAQHHEYARYLHWVGKSYVLTGGDGTYGAITFDNTSVVGVFFDVHSNYNPIGSDKKYDMEPFLRGMSAHHRSIAEGQTLDIIRLEYQGKPTSLISAAFWDDGEYLTSAFPWQEVLQNGAHIIEGELMEDMDEALEEWRDAYQMSPQQATLARRLFEHWLQNHTDYFELSRADFEELISTAESKDSINKCRGILESVQIRCVNPEEPIRTHH